MDRHPLDRPTADDFNSRTRAFLRIEREQNVHPASRALQRKPRDEQPAHLKEALRIARGRTA